jgi:hypothetical protein
MASNFDKLAGKLASRPGVTNPRALAAYIGRKKAASEGYPGAFNQAARQGRSMASVIASKKK